MPRTISERARKYVRRAAEAQFNCEVRIVHMKDPVLDETTGNIVAAENEERYAGPARISGGENSGVINIGDGEFAMLRLDVSIPWDTATEARLDDTVIVLTCPGDPELVGHVLRIVSIQAGGQMRATRTMTCQTVTENRSWFL